jgi:hypothetical protein
MPCSVETRIDVIHDRSEKILESFPSDLLSGFTERLLRYMLIPLPGQLKEPVETSLYTAFDHVKHEEYKFVERHFPVPCKILRSLLCRIEEPMIVYPALTGFEK